MTLGVLLPKGPVRRTKSQFATTIVPWFNVLFNTGVKAKTKENNECARRGNEICHAALSPEALDAEFERRVLVHQLC